MLNIDFSRDLRHKLILIAKNSQILKVLTVIKRFVFKSTIDSLKLDFIIICAFNKIPGDFWRNQNFFSNQWLF